MFNIESILRPHVRALKQPVASQDNRTGETAIFLDANENSFGSPAGGVYNRYPDPLQQELKGKISHIKGVPAHNIFLGNGSEEAIDLLLRACCTPGEDHVLTVSPARSSYAARAQVNGVDVRNVRLTPAFQLDIEAISEAVDGHTKMIFICSPNDPTGNSMDREDIEMILNNFEGLVIVDETYVNYSRQRSFISELTEYPNLVVLQTFSKAWGLAGAQVGMVFGSEAIIDVLSAMKLPYNISTPVQELVVQALGKIDDVNAWIKTTVAEREKLMRSLGQLPFVKKIFPSDANFLLVKMTDAASVYAYLANNGIAVNDQSQQEMCEGCLRITVGTPEENSTLMEKLNSFGR